MNDPTIVVCKCINNKYLYKGICYSTCPLGTFPAISDESRACLKCKPGCQTCDNKGYCTVCDTANGFILNISTKLCICNPPTIYYDGKCSLICAPGFYKKGN